MTSQLRYNFQADQAVHVADDITTLHFQILLALVVPKLIQLFTTEGLSAQPYSINFGPWNDLSEKNLFAQHSGSFVTFHLAAFGSDLDTHKNFYDEFLGVALQERFFKKVNCI